MCSSRSMSSAWWFLAVYAAAVGAVAPIEIPLKNTTLATGHVRRGLPVTIGTPPQRFALMPSLLYNNTILRRERGNDQNYCKAGDTEEQCIMENGGLFSGSASSSDTAIGLSDLAVPDTDAFGVLYGTEMNRLAFQTDNVTIESATLDSYAFAAVTDPANFTESTLGLGINSSIIKSLYDAGKVPSKRWGYWYGQMGEGAEMDGALVVGGYDESKVKGDVNVGRYPFMFDTSPTGFCYLRLTLTDITLDYGNGSSRSLFDGDIATTTACIMPDAPVLMMPQSLLSSYESASGSTFSVSGYDSTVEQTPGGFWYRGQTIAAAGAFTGSMNISIQGGPTVSIPNHELIQPDRQYSSSGEWIVYNNDSLAAHKISMTEAIPGSGQSNEFFTLGGPFLSAVYLVVDGESQSFGLNLVNPTTEKNIVSFEATSAGMNTSTSSAASESASASPTSSSESHTNTGAIAGGILGGLAFVALVLVGILWLLRRRRAAAKDQGVSGTYGAVANGQSLEGVARQEMEGNGTGIPGAVVIPVDVKRELSDNGTGSPGAFVPKHGGASPAELPHGTHLTVQEMP